MAGYIGNKAVNLSTSGADIGGTANLDAVDIDGAVNMATTALVTGVLTTTAAAVFNGGFTSNGDTATFTSANSEDPLVILKNTTNDANSARLRFVKDRGAAGVDGDDSGEIEFYADNDAQQQTLFARIKGEVQDASDGAEGGRFKFQVASHDGEIITALSLSDGSAEDEVDVTIGSGTSSVTSIAGTLTSTGVVTANAGVVVDNFTLDGTTLALSSGDFTVDVAGDIILNADGGDIHLEDGAVRFGSITKDGNDLKFNCPVADGDIKFVGNDNGVGAVTALTLDMSAGGSATFNHDVFLPTNGNLYFTSGSGFSPRISNSNSDTAMSFFTNNTERFQIATAGNVQVLTGNLVIGTAGKGIDFSAQTQSGSTTTAELLDHYEEGTWTPVAAGSSTAGSVSISARTAFYTRIGRLVHVDLVFDYTISGEAGDLQISGLPFQTAAESVGSFQCNNMELAYQSNVGQYASRVADNATLMTFRGTLTNGGDFAAMAAQSMNFLRVQLSYQTD